jgi:hypothetical protein
MRGFDFTLMDPNEQSDLWQAQWAGHDVNPPRSRPLLVVVDVFLATSNCLPAVGEVLSGLEQTVGAQG